MNLKTFYENNFCFKGNNNVALQRFAKKFRLLSDFLKEELYHFGGRHGVSLDKPNFLVKLEVRSDQRVL